MRRIMKKGRHRLHLNRETLHGLAARDLAGVAGGTLGDQYDPRPKTNAWGLYAAAICAADG